MVGKMQRILSVACKLKQAMQWCVPLYLVCQQKVNVTVLLLSSGNLCWLISRPFNVSLARWGPTAACNYGYKPGSVLGTHYCWGDQSSVEYEEYRHCYIWPVLGIELQTFWSWVLSTWPRASNVSEKYNFCQFIKQTGANKWHHLYSWITGALDIMQPHWPHMQHLQQVLSNVLYHSSFHTSCLQVPARQYWKCIVCYCGDLFILVVSS